MFPRGRRDGWAVVPVGLFALIALAHLTLLLIDRRLSPFTQWMLMPPLIGYLISNCRSVRQRLIRWQLGALVFSWLGDSLPFLFAPHGELPVRLAMFCLAMACLLVAYAPHYRRSILYSRPQLFAPYAIALVGLVAVCIPGAGMLWPLVALYGLALTVMAALATGLNARTTWGGLLFLVADGLMACTLFVPHFTLWAQDFWIMLPYLVAQALLTTGAVEASHSRSTTGQLAAAGRR